MYKRNKVAKTTITINQSKEGETIEAKVRRVMDRKEPIEDGAQLIFTERKDGVPPEYNIRTDRFEIAVDMMDVANRMHVAKRDERHSTGKGADDKPPQGPGNDGGNGGEV